ncbi:MAG: cadherin-like beta sandwich domain-containing protein, partial [Oscillospiraceae bacterium]
LDTFTINKAAQQTPSTDAALSALTVTGATITPAFSADTLAYTASVVNSATSVTIAATANGSKAVVTGNVGVKALTVGENTFTVTVTAEDGSTTKSYAVTIVRATASGGSSSSSSSQYTIRAEAHHFSQRIHPRGEGR